MKLKKMQRYDVWECFVRGRISYRATLSIDDEYWPDFAIAHIDTVEARSKREATKKALETEKQRQKNENFLV